MNLRRHWPWMIGGAAGALFALALMIFAVRGSGDGRQAAVSPHTPSPAPTQPSSSPAATIVPNPTPSPALDATPTPTTDVSVDSDPLEGITGTWEGTVEQPGYGTYPVVMVVGLRTVEIDYPTLDCGGSLTLVSAMRPEYVFTETIKYGSCVDNGEVRVSLANDELRWEWFYPDGRSGARAQLGKP